MKKVALFAFQGELMCFIHVLLNALEMKKAGADVKIVVEGAATKLIGELRRENNPMHGLYVDTKTQGLIDAVCKACSTKMQAVADIEAEGLPFAGEMSGHPSMARYMDAGYEIFIF